jgi:hypothetical protein
MTLMPAETQALPLTFILDLERIRSDNRAVLAAAATGDFSDEEELDRLGRAIGRLLAREARKPAVKRQASMAALSIAAYRYFPELEDWNERLLERRTMSAIANSPLGLMASPLPGLRRTG